MTTLFRAVWLSQTLGSSAVRFLCFLALFGFPARAVHAQSDVTPPTFVSFAFTPAAVNVSAAAQTISFSAQVTDDISGVTSVQVTFRSPTGAQNLQAFLTRITTIGSPQNAFFSGTMVVPLFSAAGTWTITALLAFDAVGNRTTLSPAVMVSLGFQTDLAVTSIPDTQAPTFVGTAILPNAVDVSAANQNLTVAFSLTDDISGVSFAPCVASQANLWNNFGVTLRSPSGLQQRFGALRAFTLVTGNPLSSTWQVTIPMPRYSEPGIWRIQSVVARDCAGNQRNMSDAQLTAAGIQSTVNVTSVPSDATPPNLTSLAITPISINTSVGNQFVTIQMGVSDALSGAEFSFTTPQLTFLDAGIQIRSPSGNQIRQAFGTQFTLVPGGTPLNGVWQAQVFFPRFSEEGTWFIDFLAIKDAARNTRTFNAAQLTAAGFNNILDIRRPSLTTDAFIGSGGGTITDDVFGSRATVTFPPGAVTGPTEVAIDVFLNPVQVPTPEGFEGPGTNFVNIHLTPHPNSFPPPGLTVVLPLPNAKPAGTPMSLYKIDEETGKLVPAISVTGSPVVGQVNFDGQSATFTGIASLSTVVGLIAQPVQVGLVVRPGGSTTINVGAQLVVNTSATEADHPNDGPWRYVLEWGDGTNFTATLTSLPTAARPLARGKVFTQPGIYTVKLTVTDKNGLRGTRTLLVTVNP